MDQDALVSEQVAGGRKLIERLVERGLDVSSAFWLRYPDDGDWELHIATPRVDPGPKRPVYAEVQAALRSLDGDWASELERVPLAAVRLLRASHPLAREAEQAAGDRVGAFNAKYGPRRASNGSIVGAVVYTGLPAPSPA